MLIPLTLDQQYDGRRAGQSRGAAVCRPDADVEHGPLLPVQRPAQTQHAGPGVQQQLTLVLVHQAVLDLSRHAWSGTVLTIDIVPALYSINKQNLPTREKNDDYFIGKKSTLAH